MPQLLTIDARPDAPVACDLTGADDTLVERLAEYRRLFDHALTGRASSDTETTFRFALRPGVRDWVLDLVRREAACCPFLSYEVRLEDEQVVWTTRGIGIAAMGALDDALTSVAEPTSDPAGLARLLEDRGGVPIILPT